MEEEGWIADRVESGENGACGAVWGRLRWEVVGLGIGYVTCGRLLGVGLGFWFWMSVREALESRREKFSTLDLENFERVSRFGVVQLFSASKESFFAELREDFSSLGPNEPLRWPFDGAISGCSPLSGEF